MLRLTTTDVRHARIGSQSSPPAAGLDPRNVLAAERTYLAWVRTCLALLATGSAISALPLLPERVLRGAVGLACIAAVGPIAIAAHAQWRKVCHAAAGSGLPGPRRTALLLTSVVLLTMLALGSAIGLRLLVGHPHARACRRPILCAARR